MQSQSNRSGFETWIVLQPHHRLHRLNPTVVVLKRHRFCDFAKSTCKSQSNRSGFETFTVCLVLLITSKSQSNRSGFETLASARLSLCCSRLNPTVVVLKPLKGEKWTEVSFVSIQP